MKMNFLSVQLESSLKYSERQDCVVNLHVKMVVI